MDIKIKIGDIIDIIGPGTLRVETDKHKRVFKVEFLNNITEKINQTKFSCNIIPPILSIEYVPLQIKTTKQLYNFISEYYFFSQKYEKKNIIITDKNNIKYKLVNFVVISGDININNNEYLSTCSFDHVKQNII